jgi:hypothetical protein
MMRFKDSHTTFSAVIMHAVLKDQSNVANFAILIMRLVIATVTYFLGGGA